METKAKAKVVASVGGGADFVQFLAAPAVVLSRSIWKNRMNSTVFSEVKWIDKGFLISAEGFMFHVKFFKEIEHKYLSCT